MQIPVFVSVGSRLSSEQAQTRDHLYKLLRDMSLDLRTVGTSDYPSDNPLREVAVLARHCAGALILGFKEYHIEVATRINSAEEDDHHENINGQAWSTSWNQIEAGMCYALGLPMSIFKDDSVQGGVFDVGSTGLFVQRIPQLSEWERNRAKISEVLWQWRTQVQARYYGDM
jgi:hypothetical protein